MDFFLSDLMSDNLKTVISYFKLVPRIRWHGIRHRSSFTKRIYLLDKYTINLMPFYDAHAKIENSGKNRCFFISMSNNLVQLMR